MSKEIYANSKQAKLIDEIDFAVRHDIPVSADHPYFVDFSSVRGRFKEERIFRAFNVTSDFTYNVRKNQFNKTLLFLGGMRGSGKTSEIKKYVSKLDNPECFFCVVCNIDKELDTNEVEYMDILILQIEKLLEKAQEKNLTLDDGILKDMQNWFGKRIKQINKQLKLESGASIELGAGTGIFSSFLNLALKLKAGITGSKTTANQIRTELKNNFTEFITLYNDFIETTNQKLREQNIAKELFFVIDGIEKTMSAETRRKIIIEESNRIKQINANTLFTLPVELLSEIQKLKMFSNVASFPFVKIKEQNGDLVTEAIEKFKEFTYKRISPELFDDEKTVEKAIIYSGGSPRELLRIYEEARFNVDEKTGKITMNDVDNAIEYLAAECSHYLTSENLEILKKLKENNIKGKPTTFSPGLQTLLEQLIVMEYNEGSYKRVNPVVEASKIYKEYVK